MSGRLEAARDPLVRDNNHFKNKFKLVSNESRREFDGVTYGSGV